MTYMLTTECLSEAKRTGHIAGLTFINAIPKFTSLFPTLTYTRIEAHNIPRTRQGPEDAWESRGPTHDAVPRRRAEISWKRTIRYRNISKSVTMTTKNDGIGSKKVKFITGG